MPLHLRRSLIAIIPLALLAFVIPAAEGQGTGSTIPSTATGGTILIDQTPLEGLVGRWTLLKPYHLTESSRHQEKSIDAHPGTYTVIIEPPQGAVANVRIFRGTEQLQSVDRPQVTFTVAAGEALRVSVHYNFAKTGEISISSDPPGLAYKLEGPNATNYPGVTQNSYPSMPLGLYSVVFTVPEGCPALPVKSDQLQENKRISFHVKLECAAAVELREQHHEMTEMFITIIVDGAELPLIDVPQDAWFATFVFDAAKGGMVSGYKDEDGKFTGKFGPGNPVTVAELAKIAHRLGGVQEGDISASSLNPAVPATAWFAPYLASAEHRGWTIYADATIDPLRPATRGEVIITLLQALDVAVDWPKGKIFTDVDWKTPYAGAIETAAGDKVVSGTSDADGNPTGLFAPASPVTRAEIAKMLVSARDAYRK